MEPTVADYRELIRSEGASLLAQLDRLSAADWTGFRGPTASAG